MLTQITELLDDFGSSFTSLVGSIRTIMLPTNKRLESHKPLRDSIIKIVQSDSFSEKLKTELKRIIWNNNEVDELNEKIVKTLILELKGVTNAIEVSNIKKSKTRKKLLGSSSIAIGSIKDFCNKNETLSLGLTVFKEAIDLFKGD